MISAAELTEVGPSTPRQPMEVPAQVVEALLAAELVEGLSRHPLPELVQEEVL